MKRTSQLHKLLVYLTRLGSVAMLSFFVLSCGTPATPTPTEVPPPTGTASPTIAAPTAAAIVPATGTPAPTPLAAPTAGPAKPLACNFTIDPKTRTADAASDFAGIKPGDVVCIPAGERKGLRLLNFKGTAQAPITFINSGGKVLIDASTGSGGVGIELYGSQHVRITGTGDPKETYGIEIQNGQNAGVDTNKPGASGKNDGTEYIELDHLFIHNVGAGIRTAKNNDLLNSGGTWSGHQYLLHDNYIKTTKNEGMYIGTSGNSGASFPIYDIEVWNNRIEETGYDAVQIRQAHDKVLVHNNYIDGTGLDPCKNDTIDNTAGFNIASGTDTGDWYNNTVIGGRKGFYVKDASNVRIYNNLVIDSGHATSGLSGPECPANVTSTTAEGALLIVDSKNIQFFFNTVVNAKVNAAYGISMKNSTGTIHDNIVGGLFDNLVTGTGVIMTNNLMNKDLGFFAFVNPGQGNFRLTPASPAVGHGSDNMMPSADMEGAKRGQDGKSDIGAYQNN